jgi:hypothetical protein
MNEIESLCESCAHMREVVTPRGSRFLLCLLSQSDHRFPRYPPQPLLLCKGYERRGGDSVESKEEGQ